MASGKKQMDLPKPAPARMDQPKVAPSAEKTYQAPSTEPPPSTPAPAVHHPIPQFRFVAPIELNINTSFIISQVLSEKVYLSVEELLALAPKVRRHFKETTTMKKLPALLADAQAMAAHTVSTYSMDMDHEHLVADLALPLWMIEITLDGTITVMGIIDSSCQVIIICSNIWERLGTPMKHEQVMFIELANGQANATMGTIPNICFSVREVSLYYLVQVVRNALSNVSFVYPSLPLHPPSARSSQMGVHTSYSPTQTQWPPSWF